MGCSRDGVLRVRSGDNRSFLPPFLWQQRQASCSQRVAMGGTSVFMRLALSSSSVGVQCVTLWVSVCVCVCTCVGWVRVYMSVHITVRMLEETRRLTTDGQTPVAPTRTGKPRESAVTGPRSPSEYSGHPGTQPRTPGPGPLGPRVAEPCLCQLCAHLLWRIRPFPLSR